MNDWPMYRDMTEEQRLAWGAAEAEARVVDLRVRSKAGLVAAQEAAKARRRAIDASVSAAASMVSTALRAKRVKEFQSGAAS